MSLEADSFSPKYTEKNPDQPFKFVEFIAQQYKIIYDRIVQCEAIALVCMKFHLHSTL